jgi:hypothetical protein
MKNGDPVTVWLWNLVPHVGFFAVDYLGTEPESPFAVTTVDGQISLA